MVINNGINIRYRYNGVRIYCNVPTMKIVLNKNTEYRKNA